MGVFRGIRAGAVAAAAAGLIVAGCGGGDEEKAESADPTTIRCPLAPVGGDAAGRAQQYEPADDAFDTAELIGLPLREARARAAQHTCEIVVSLKDGRGVPVPIDVDPQRIYVFTEKGVVTEIEGVGGGI